MVFRRRTFSEKRGGGSERGVAIVEFVIALPFLITLTVSVVDIGRTLKEYFYLRDAVAAGAERAMAVSQLADGVTYANTTANGCSGQTHATHTKIHERIIRLMGLQNKALSQPCVTTKLTKGGTGSTRDTVLVQASAEYQGFFPLFDGLEITAQTRVPYVY